MYNLNHLKYFYVCAQTGSVTKAAHKLNVSQPSMSMQIIAFEEQLGFHLFSRIGRSLQLTPRGHEIFKISSKIFELTDELDRYVKKNEHSQELLLNIGVSEEVERPFLSEVVGKLIKANNSKKLMVTIISKSNEEVINLLASEEADVIITNQKIPRYTLVEEFKLPVFLVSTLLSSQLRVNQTNNISYMLSTLGQSLINPTSDMVLGKEIKSHLKNQQVKFDTALQSNIIACIVRGVQEKVGAAFLPIMYVNKEIKNGSLHIYGPRGGFWQHSLYVYTNKNEPNSYINGLVKIIKNLSIL